MKRVVSYLFICFAILLLPLFLFPAANEAELMFGATNIYGIVGEGGTTAAFSKWGELTVLRWPNPSYYELLNYTTSSAPDARELPHLGALDNMGGFGGLVFFLNDKKVVTFFRDPVTWSVTTEYYTDNSGVLVHRFHSDEYSIDVTQVDFVHPESDVLTIAFNVRYPDTITGVKLFFFLNPALSMKRIEFVPLSSYMDKDKGFLLSYSRTGQYFIDYVPPSLTQDSLDKLNSWLGTISGENIESKIEGIGDYFGKGLYLVVGSSFPISEFQCGVDREILQRSSIQDAYQDLMDGKLSENQISTNRVDLALMGNVKSGEWNAIYLSSANTQDEALSALSEVKNSGFSSLLQDILGWWENFTAKAKIPGDIPEDEKRFVLRTVITIATSMDKKTGAIVASVANQPPYFLDWPRDGAFINYFLDTVGYHDLVLKHEHFYADMQRKWDYQKALTPNSPAGTFAMNFFPDGMVGGPIDFEIDETGLVLWSWCIHGKFISDEKERKEYYNEFYPDIKLAAEALMKCRDPDNKLQCPASEDDNIFPTQGLQGAVTEYLGLKSAAEVAGYLGKIDDMKKWESRAEELNEAIYENLYDKKLRRFNGNFEYYGNGSWAMWPVELWPKNDPRWVGQIDYAFNTLQGNILHPSPYGSAYDAKTAVAMDYILPATDSRRDTLGEIVHELSVNLPLKGTFHVGEAYMPIYEGNTYHWLDVTSIPHVWEASLISLSVLAYYHPEVFEQISLPVNYPPPAKKKKSAGCSSGSPDAGLLIFFLLVLLYLWQRGLRVHRD